jgi:MFS transporter, MHS family, proline/betaine transporter
VFTVSLMAIATGLVAVLPGYSTIGIWAPILLVVLRLAQGFSTGGEWGGAATFLVEYAPSGKRGLIGTTAPTLTNLVIVQFMGAVLYGTVFAVIPTLLPELFPTMSSIRAVDLDRPGANDL